MRPHFPTSAALLLGLTAILAAGKPVTSGRIALVHEANLTGSVVTLADLLPATAPAELRTAGSKVMLGGAPQPGVKRQITRQELDRALADRPELGKSLVLPEFVVVQRCHRQLTSAELESAVLGALKKAGVPDSELDNLKELNLSAPVYVTQADPGLRVIGLEYDALHQETRLRLWTAREPQVLPFYISLRGRVSIHGRTNSPATLPGGSHPGARLGVRAGSQGWASGNGPLGLGSAGWPSTEPIGAVQGPTEVLVKAGLPTKLYFQGAGFRVETVVIPLEPGAIGQEIRVRRQDNHRLLVAHVVGHDLLQAN